MLSGSWSLPASMWCVGLTGRHSAGRGVSGALFPSPVQSFHSLSAAGPQSVSEASGPFWVLGHGAAEMDNQEVLRPTDRKEETSHLQTLNSIRWSKRTYFSVWKLDCVYGVAAVWPRFSSIIRGGHCIWNDNSFVRTYLVLWIIMLELEK